MENVSKSSFVETMTKSCISIATEAMKYKMFIIALLTTIFFYYPALQHGSIDAGLLYSGDILAYYLPALMKTHALLSGHHFSAIDYSLFNGSSDFFLNANFFPLHPLVIIHSLLIPFNTATLQSTGQFLVLMLAFHSFIACYFSLKLFTRYFAFELGEALLIAIGFTFSWHMIAALMEPPFVFCASVIPWVIYSTLRYSENASVSLLLRACLPVTLCILGGYLPVGLACLALCAFFIAAKLLYIDANFNKPETSVRALILASLPFFLATLITSPYLYAAYAFLKQTSSGNGGGLYYSALQLAELPQSFIRLVSSQFAVPGPSAEFKVIWGIIGLTIFAIFFLSQQAMQALDAREWRIFKIAGIMYFATVLAIYGEHSAVSSMVYYWVPQIGKMHIYQRFLLPSQLLLMVMVALMLKALLTSRPQKASQLALVILSLIAFACGFLMTYRSNYALMFGINNFLLFEIILGCLFTGLLLIPGKSFVCYSTILLLSLPAVNQMYSLSQGMNTFAEARQHEPIALDKDLQSRLLTYLKRFDHKQIIKYVDITPLWNKSGVETFPKDFPYFVLNEVNLSSYGGATFYLSAVAKYMQKMPVVGDVTVKPDWQWLRSTGADFIIANRDDTASNALLQDLLKKNKPEDIYDLPGNVIIIPLQAENNSLNNALYDNGYFRVYTANMAAMISKNFYSNNANYMRFEFKADKPTTVQYLFWNNSRLKYYLNGKRIRPSYHDGLKTIDVPAGQNIIEVRYIHWPLILFWVFYTVFAFLWVCTFIPGHLKAALKKNIFNADIESGLINSRTT